MHFYYLDESGDTGTNLNDSKQPIFVLGGISINDKSWNKTQEEFFKIIKNYFNTIPDNFELHSHELLSPNGEGIFKNHNLEKRLSLVFEILEFIESRKHSIHYMVIDKQKLNKNTDEFKNMFDYPLNPYLLSYDYLISYINSDIKKNLGKSARGMIIFDEKRNLQSQIEQISYTRKYKTPKTQRIKQIVEFSYSIDSKKNPMIQISDLIVLLIRRFYEIENNYKDQWPNDVKKFYYDCFKMIYNKVKRKKLITDDKYFSKKKIEYLKSIIPNLNRSWQRKQF